jgi:hypothetical protein
VGPVPDPLLIRKSGSPGNRTRDLWVFSQDVWLLDHRTHNSSYTTSTLSYDRRSVLCRATIWDPRTIFLFSSNEIIFRQLTVSYYEAPSLTRGWFCNLHVQVLLGLSRAVTLEHRSRGPCDHTLVSFEAGFPFIATYDSQSYGGDILNRLHTGSDITQIGMQSLCYSEPWPFRWAVQKSLLSTVLLLLRASAVVVTLSPLIHCLAMDVLTEPLPRNDRLCRLHNPGFQQTYRRIGTCPLNLRNN